MDYQEKRILNPSYPAAVAMILRYGGQPLSLLANFRRALPEKRGWATVEKKDNATLADLKAILDHDIPILVVLTRTPAAHPADRILGLMARMKSLKLPEPKPTSGTLEEMWSVADYMNLKKSMGADFHWESVLVHARVIVGYDDARQMIIMHDPLFGPGVEVSYADFELMWAPNDHGLIAVEPKKRSVAMDSSGFRARTPAEVGVERLIKGYGLESSGRFSEADSTLRSALTISGLPFELRYLVFNELGYVAANRGDVVQAIQFADSASAIGPESPSPWRLRLEVARSGRVSEPAQRRVEAEQMLNRLCADSAALLTLKESLERYVGVYSFGCPAARQ